MLPALAKPELRTLDILVVDWQEKCNEIGSVDAQLM